MIRKPRAICFDIDGTLYPRRVLDRNLFRLSVIHPVLSRRYFLARKAMRKEGFPKSMRDAEAFLKREAELCKVSADVLRRKFYENLSNFSRRLPAIPEVVSLIKRAREEGIEVYLMSDFPVKYKVEALGLCPWVSAAFTAEEFGCLKPDRRAFDTLSERIGISAEDLLYIGDSYEKDIAGAKGAGYMTAHFTPDKKSGKDADYAFSSYADLERLLWKV